MNLTHKIVFVLFFTLTGCSQKQSQDDSSIKHDKTILTKTDSVNEPQSKIETNQTDKDTSYFESNEKDKKLFKDFLKNYTKESQVFSIDNSKDTLIKCTNGTIIFLPYWSFEINKGESIKLKVTEFYDNSNMILNGLSTASSGKILETGGMLKIEAFANNRKLSLAKRKKIILHFPKKEKDSTMSLFYGKVDNESIDWKQDQEALFQFKLAVVGSTSTPNWRDLDIEKDMNDVRNEFEIFPLRDKIIANISLNQKELKNIYENDIKTNIGLEFGIEDNNNPKIIIENSPNQKTTEIIKSTIKNYLADFSKENPSWRQDRHESFRLSARPTPLNNYKEKFKNKYHKSIDNNIESMDFRDLQFYVFQASELGWINCDRFINYTNEKIDFVVKVEHDFIGQINLKINSINSLLTANQNDNYFVFKDIPKDLDVKVIAIKMEKRKPYLSIMETKTTKNEVVLSAFKEFSINELKQEIN
jgi:hypothetical protein